MTETRATGPRPPAWQASPSVVRIEWSGTTEEEITMSDAETGQVVSGAAEVYERIFLPAIFERWAPRVCDAAGIREGDAVLDVACGTGVVARTARERVGKDGEVIGVDLNPGMLAIALRREPTREWVEAPAERLPFGDDRFDAVLCQFGLMFFDQVVALREMRRVARPGAPIVVAVWTGLDQVPGYAAVVELLDEFLGGWAADSVRAPYVLGDTAELRELFEQAGLSPSIRTEHGTTRFGSVEDLITAELMGWTIADRVSQADLDRLLAAAPERLAPFVKADGVVEFDHPAHVVTARA
jgi:SAM-dependent methyltransferase